MNRLLLLLCSTVLLLQIGCAQKAPETPTTFTLRSNNVGGQATLEQVFCGGKNQSPQLSWVNAPKDTKSFAITLYDPDAPTGSGWWHWMVVNIPANVTELAAGAGSAESQLLPKGALQLLNDYGEASYGGPCPPEGHGPHLYLMTIYALDTEQLDVKASTPQPQVGFQLNAKALAKASFVFYYER